MLGMESRVFRVLKAHPREKKVTQKEGSGDLGGSLLSLQLGTNKHLHVRKLSKVGEIIIAKDQREQHSELMQGQ